MYSRIIDFECVKEVNNIGSMDQPILTYHASHSMRTEETFTTRSTIASSSRHVLGIL